MKTIDKNNETLRDLMETCLNLDQDKLCAWRGQSDSNHSLIPGIYRGLEKLVPPFNVDDDYEWLCQLERDTYRNFVDKGRGVNASRVSSDKWENLIYGQHHGLPTRLLDWTTDIFAAIYFAVTDHHDKDGAVWHINIKEFPHPKVLGRLSRNGAFRLEAVRSCVDSSNLVFFVPQSRSTVLGPGSLEFVGPPGFPSDQSKDSNRSGFLTFLFAPYTDDRIRNQKGIFSIYLTNDPTDIVLDHASYVEHLENVYSSELLTKITIPASKKASIKRDLIKTGKDAFSIYPDLEGLVMMLKDERSSTLDFWNNDRKKWTR